MQTKNSQKTNLSLVNRMPARLVPLGIKNLRIYSSRKCFVIKYGGMRRYGSGMSGV